MSAMSAHDTGLPPRGRSRGRGCVCERVRQTDRLRGTSDSGAGWEGRPGADTAPALPEATLWGLLRAPGGAPGVSA